MSATDVATLVSPLFIIGGGLIAFARWLWAKFEKKLESDRQLTSERVEERHKETTQTLSEIKTQTTATNGRVNELERQNSTFRDRLSHAEGSIEVLLREKGHPL